ncbi:unnamed protein product [Owenia fusiformis]|uniref:Uncharacterized protein n=1 Tax=Owenia fusiformis TaxID=6347 RepID=A0A8J1UA27_OWEFU|nr:unnamed protein product [Owenia fusiformis]
MTNDNVNAMDSTGLRNGQEKTHVVDPVMYKEQTILTVELLMIIVMIVFFMCLIPVIIRCRNRCCSGNRCCRCVQSCDPTYDEAHDGDMSKNTKYIEEHQNYGYELGEVVNNEPHPNEPATPPNKSKPGASFGLCDM